MKKQGYEYLRELGLNPTMQRLAVLEHLSGHRTHPTIEEVYAAVRKRHPTISKATVYNVMDALKKAGALQELTIERQAARYDINVSPHPHFLCRQCGKLYDIDIPCAIRPGDMVNGHRTESVQTYIFGVCSQCNIDNIDSNISHSEDLSEGNDA